MTRRIALAALLLTTSLGAQVGVPSTPAGRVLAAWLEAFNSGDLEKVRAFDRSHRADSGPTLPPPEGTIRFRAQTGGFTLVRIEKTEPSAVVALLQERDSDAMARLELSVTADDPPKIATFTLRPAQRPADLALPRLTETQALDALSKRIDELAAADRFSGIVLVARDGKVLLQKTAGMANRESKSPVTPDTRFRLGSMNKMFTAVTILRLAARKKLSLDDPVATHLPSVLPADAGTRVTVRHLLTHTGGTGDIFGPEFAKNRLNLREHGDYLKLYAGRALTHEPGAEWRYSNFGYVLLGAIIERVAGMSYYDAVRREVFESAGMNATASEPETSGIENRSLGYMRRNDEWTSNADTLPWRGTAAGGGYSTAGDLLRFARALESGELIDKALLAEATTPFKEPHYGYGFGIHGEGALRSYGHSGGAPGMNGDLRIFPALGIVLIGLANVDPPAASRAVDFYAQRMPAPAAPPGTDIWLARLTDKGLEQPINITNRAGYDNQPSFTSDGKGILFTRSDPPSPEASARQAQTDIYLYDFTSRSSAPTPITSTPESEYSPTVTPDGQGISVIRVESDNTQRLWRFTRDGKNPTIILRDVKPVGYHAWGPLDGAQSGLLALFVLGEPNTLQVADSRTGRSRIVAQRIGRSIHRIPGRDTISVLHVEGESRTIKELDLKTRTLKPIAPALKSNEGDYAWTPDGRILMSDGKSLMAFKDGKWSEFADLAALGLAGASRMAVSPDGRWVAVVTPDGRR